MPQRRRVVIQEDSNNLGRINQNFFNTIKQKKICSSIHFTLRIIKKGVIYRTNIVAWESNEVIQRTFILFDTGVMKTYKFPKFEQTHHMQLDIIKTSMQPVKMQVYQEYVILNSNTNIVIIDGVTQAVVRTMTVGWDITVKMHKTEVTLLPLLMEENVYFLLASASGTVLMVHLSSKSKLRLKKARVRSARG